MNSPYCVFIGKAECAQLERERERALTLVAQSIYCDFPDVLDRKLYVGDLSPVSGDCPGHPGSSHGRKISADIDYYTMLSSNNTQRWGPGLTPVKIWEEPGEVLLPNAFDWERNYIFIRRLLQLMPGTTYRTNDVLLETIDREARKKYGFNATKDIRPHMVGDKGTTYNHHIHAHLDLEEVDPCIKVRNLFPIL